MGTMNKLSPERIEQLHHLHSPYVDALLEHISEQEKELADLRNKTLPPTTTKWEEAERAQSQGVKELLKAVGELLTQEAKKGNWSDLHEEVAMRAAARALEGG